MKRLAQILLIMAMGALCGAMDAQTNTPTVTVNITAARVAAVASVTPTVLNLSPGSTGTLTFSVTGPSGSTTVPTGTVELLGRDPSTNKWILVNSFPLVNGQATCTYPIPTSTPIGTYTVGTAYSGDKNYLPSPEYQ